MKASAVVVAADLSLHSPHAQVKQLRVGENLGSTKSSGACAQLLWWVNTFFPHEMISTATQLHPDGRTILPNRSATTRETARLQASMSKQCTTGCEGVQVVRIMFVSVATRRWTINASCKCE